MTKKDRGIGAYEHRVTCRREIYPRGVLPKLTSIQVCAAVQDRNFRGCINHRIFCLEQDFKFCIIYKLFSTGCNNSSRIKIGLTLFLMYKNFLLIHGFGLHLKFICYLASVS